MAVPEQTPYIEHTGNGATTSFSLGFQCESKDHLIVLVDEIEPPIETWSLIDGKVVFTTAPATGKKITIQRNTPFGRTTDYQSFNNSFRPQPVNGDFDRVWYKIQELGVKDWLLDLKIQKFRDDVNLTALENTLIQAQELRDSTAVLADEVLGNTNQSQTLLANTTEQANAAALSATNANNSKELAKQYADNIDASLTAIAGGHKAYATLAGALANTSTFPRDSIVEITNDGANNGTYLWNGGDLTKSDYDPLTQAKADATTKANAAEEKAKEYTRNNTLAAKKSSVGSGLFFTDARGVPTWLGVSGDGGLPGLTIKYISDAIGFERPVYATSNKYLMVFTDVAGRIAFSINKDGTASTSGGGSTAQRTKGDLATIAFYGSSSMYYMQDDIYNALKNAYPDEIKSAKYYGESGAMLNHALTIMGVNNGQISFNEGQISEVYSDITSVSMPYGLPGSSHMVKGTLENGIKGTMGSSKFKATSAADSMSIDSNLGITFISDGTAHNNAVAVVNLGKNNMSSVLDMHINILKYIREAVAYLDANNGGHTIILGHFVDLGSQAGEQREITNLNRKLKAIYLDRFIDVQAYLMSEQVWTDLGLTKTTADIDAIAAGQLPPSLARDSAHLSPAIDTQIASKVLNLINQKGWYN